MTQNDVWANWVTIWQSEMAALATDREIQEAIQRGVDLWASSALALGAGACGIAHEAGSAGAVPPPGAPAAVPAPGGRERAPVEPGRG